MSHEDDKALPSLSRPLKPNWKSLREKSIQPGGFGEDRTRIWPELLNVNLAATPVTEPDGPQHSTTDDTAKIESRISDDTEKSPGYLPHRDERQIGLDTDRSFVLYPVEDARSRDELQAQLHALIVTIFRKRPHLNYFQGYHDIISVLFLTLPEELQAPCVEKLSLHRLRDSMGASLEPVVGLLRVLKRLLQVVDPEFSALLERAAPLPYFALSNLLTLFAHDMPTLPLIQHVFDYLICRHPIAIVYLVAAVVLSRRDDALRLEHEGEEGMIHSILSSIPDIYEEGDDPLPVEAGAENSEIQTEATSGDPGILAEKEETAAADGLAEDEVSSPKVDDSLEEEKSSGNTSSTPVDVHDDSQGKKDDTLHVHETPEEATDKTLSPPPSYTELEQSIDSDTDSEVKEVPEKTISSRPPSPASDDDVIPRPRVTLTSLLMRADELYEQYPPSHSSIMLSSIMGPQSVMLTWSEDPADLPSDDDAELMVTKPELVVLPYIEPEDEVASDDESGYVSGTRGRRRNEKEEHDRRRRRKLRKPRHLLVERKTMVAGAVLVLGVAMAVYGYQAGGPGGLFRSEGYQQRRPLVREWKRVSRFVGGLALGVGERMFENLWH